MSKKKQASRAATHQPQPQIPIAPQTPSPKPAQNKLPPVVWVLAGVLALLVMGAAAALVTSSTQKPIEPTVVPTATRPASAGGTVDYCRTVPKFREALGFGTQAVLSTAERNTMGAVMIQPNSGISGTNQTYQHPTWKSAGYLGHVIFDRKGDVYTFPVPYVSLLDNPPEKQNMIYRIDGATAVMSPFLTLESAAPPSTQNPFGVLGLTYDCDTNSLYASSVAGSTRDAEVGRIYRIDMNTGKVVFTFDNIDVFGMGIYVGPAGKRLYFGSARTPEVYSVAVDANGNLVGDTKLELTIPDPNFKARRVIFDRNGGLQVRGFPFDYSLVVTSERNEKFFNFKFDSATQKWILQSQG